MTKRVALYARVSTKDKGQDHENQLIQLRAFAKTQHWRLSMSTLTRPAASAATVSSSRRCSAQHPAVSSTCWLLVPRQTEPRGNRGDAEPSTATHRLRCGLSVVHGAVPRQYGHTSRRPSSGSWPLWPSRSGCGSVNAPWRAWNVRRAQGRVGGRPKAEDDPSTLKMFAKLKRDGLSVRKIAAKMGVSPTTVQKLARVAA